MMCQREPLLSLQNCVRSDGKYMAELFGKDRRHSIVMEGRLRSVYCMVP